MPSQRQSDENSSPDQEVELKTETVIKSETKPSKPLLQSNDTSGTSKKKLSSFEKKDRERFEKSGMKKGSLVKYCVKVNPEEMHKPLIRSRSSSTCTARNILSTDDAGNGIMNQNQVDNNDVISVGSDDSLEALANSPRVSDLGEDASDFNLQLEPVLDEELSSEDKIERWQRQNKRYMEDDDESQTNNCSELRPPPSKTSKLDMGSGGEAQLTTPDNSQESCSSTPQLRIVSVYTLAGNDATPGTSTSDASSSSSSVENMKKTIFMYKETDDPSLTSFIEKKNWRKAVDIIKKGLQTYKLPSRHHMSHLIRKAILCDNIRVSKDVQLESIKLLEDIMKNYPPYNGGGRDPSVRYYKEILEQVFDEEVDNKLYLFLTKLHERIQEKNALQLLVLVTELVSNQYEIYEKESGVKIHPPLFQYFLEENDVIFKYNQYCLAVIEKCCKKERTDEEFCIFLKWVDLISRRLGNFSVRRKDYLRMIIDFSKLCLGQKDLGLVILMNLSYKPFSKSVCEAIFDEKLRIVRSDGEDANISETEKNFYLAELAKTLLIKPAFDIVSDVVEKACKTNKTLVYKQLAVDATESNKQNCDSHQSIGRRKNVKGETRLHILCRPDQNNPVQDVKKHLDKFPDDINVKDNFGNTPLHDCAKYDKGNIIMTFMELYERRKLKQINFLARNGSMETPMHLAATYCDPQTTEILLYFAQSCGVRDQVLTAANGNGKLPFQLADPKSQIQRKLTPAGYDEQSMVTHEGLTLDQDSIEILENSFELRKLLAWWSHNCL